MAIPLPPRLALPRRLPLERAQPGEAVIPELEDPAAPPRAALDLIHCPQCSEFAPIDGPACPHCGFPFSCELAGPRRERRAQQLETWRVVVGVMALVMLLATGGLYRDGVSEYQGYTFKLVSQLQPAQASGIPLLGSPAFVGRTELALGLIEQRAPEFYWRLQENVKQIDYLSPERLNSPLGRQVRMEGIGAVSTPMQRTISVLPVTAFPDGAEANDRALFNYAATLVHELRHIELHWAGLAPGGWQEEVLCEQAALAFLQQADAPLALIADKRVYLDNPQAPRYQQWYDWYKQFDE